MSTIISFHLSRLLESASLPHSLPRHFLFSFFLLFLSRGFTGFRQLGYYIPRGKVHESNKRLDTPRGRQMLASDSSSRSTPKERYSRDATAPRRRSDEEFLSSLLSPCESRRTETYQIPKLGDSKGRYRENRRILCYSGSWQYSNIYDGKIFFAHSTLRKENFS